MEDKKTFKFKAYGYNRTPTLKVLKAEQNLANKLNRVKKFIRGNSNQEIINIQELDKEDPIDQLKIEEYKSAIRK